MTIASLPPQNHINALRAFLSRIRRMSSVPSAQEIAHAEDSLRELESALKALNNSPSTILNP